MPNRADRSDAITRAIAGNDLETLRRALEASPLAERLGIAFTEVSPGRARAVLPTSDLLPNFLGFSHTGALFTLAEQTLAAAANSMGYLGLPLNCDLHFLKGADPSAPVEAEAHVVDTQGRIARVLGELTQGGQPVARVTEMVFLRSGNRL